MIEEFESKRQSEKVKRLLVKQSHLLETMARECKAPVTTKVVKRGEELLQLLEGYNLKPLQYNAMMEKYKFPETHKSSTEHYIKQIDDELAKRKASKNHIGKEKVELPTLEKEKKKYNREISIQSPLSSSLGKTHDYEAQLNYHFSKNSPKIKDQVSTDRSIKEELPPIKKQGLENPDDAKKKLPSIARKKKLLRKAKMSKKPDLSVVLEEDKDVTISANAVNEKDLQEKEPTLLSSQLDLVKPNPIKPIRIQSKKELSSNKGAPENRAEEEPLNQPITEINSPLKQTKGKGEDGKSVKVNSLKKPNQESQKEEKNLMDQIDEMTIKKSKSEKNSSAVVNMKNENRDDSGSPKPIFEGPQTKTKEKEENTVENQEGRNKVKTPKAETHINKILSNDTEPRILPESFPKSNTTLNEDINEKVNERKELSMTQIDAKKRLNAKTGTETQLEETPKSDVNIKDQSCKKIESGIESVSRPKSVSNTNDEKNQKKGIVTIPLIPISKGDAIVKEELSKNQETIKQSLKSVPEKSEKEKKNEFKQAGIKPSDFGNPASGVKVMLNKEKDDRKENIEEKSMIVDQIEKSEVKKPNYNIIESISNDQSNRLPSKQTSTIIGGNEIINAPNPGTVDILPTEMKPTSNIKPSIQPNESLKPNKIESQDKPEDPIQTKIEKIDVRENTDKESSSNKKQRSELKNRIRDYSNETDLLTNKTIKTPILPSNKASPPNSISHIILPSNNPIPQSSPLSKHLEGKPIPLNKNTSNLKKSVPERYFNDTPNEPVKLKNMEAVPKIPPSCSLLILHKIEIGNLIFSKPCTFLVISKMEECQYKVSKKRLKALMFQWKSHSLAAVGYYAIIRKLRSIIFDRFSYCQEYYLSDIENIFEVFFK